jgi:hypothetical protein
VSSSFSLALVQSRLPPRSPLSTTHRRTFADARRVESNRIDKGHDCKYLIFSQHPPPLPDKVEAGHGDSIHVFNPRILLPALEASMADPRKSTPWNKPITAASDGQH